LEPEARNTHTHTHTYQSSLAIGSRKTSGIRNANYALISLASKLSFLQCNWGFDVVHSKTIMIGYESFMVEVGLYGNTMSYEYKKHSMLSTKNTWYKNVWELCHYYNIWLNFIEDLHLKSIKKEINL
jgi:hypothetical protein